MNISSGNCIIVLDKEKKRYLAGKRLNCYQAGKFGMPGGRIDGDESLERSCSRELMEETGLKSSDFTYVGTVREVQSNGVFILFGFICNSYTGYPKVMEPDKCEKWEWIPLERQIDLLSNHRAILDMASNPTAPRLADI